MLVTNVGECHQQNFLSVSCESKHAIWVQCMPGWWAWLTSVTQRLVDHQRMSAYSLAICWRHADMYCRHFCVGNKWIYETCTFLLIIYKTNMYCCFRDDIEICCSQFSLCLQWNGEILTRPSVIRPRPQVSRPVSRSGPQGKAKVVQRMPETKNYNVNHKVRY